MRHKKPQVVHIVPPVEGVFSVCEFVSVSCRVPKLVNVVSICLLMCDGELQID